MTTNLYARRAATLQAERAHPKHLAAVRRLEHLRAQRRNGVRRLAAALRDWGSAGTPSAAWQAVDARARESGIAVCYLAEFDAVSLSAGPDMHAYAGTPSQALASISALAALREARP